MSTQSPAPQRADPQSNIHERVDVLETPFTADESAPRPFVKHEGPQEDVANAVPFDAMAIDREEQSKQEAGQEPEQEVTMGEPTTGEGQQNIKSEEGMPSKDFAGVPLMNHGYDASSAYNSLPNGIAPAFDGLAQLQYDLPPAMPLNQFPDYAYTVDDPSSEILTQEQTGYFKLEFPDAQLYIGTLKTLFGRDTDAVRKRKLASHLDSQYDAASIISESGGIVNYGLTEPRHKAQRSRRTSRSSSVPRRSRRNSLTRHESFPNIHLADIRKTGDRPSARIQSKSKSVNDDTTLVKLHAQEGQHGGGISREHAAIIYNFEEQAFELHIYGRNGAFMNDEYYSQGSVVNLVHGCKITISGVVMRWLLPNDGQGVLGSEAQSAMSFEFEDGRGESIAMEDTSDPSSSEEEPEEELALLDQAIHSGSDEELSSEDEVAALLNRSEGDEEDEDSEEIDQEPQLAKKSRLGKRPAKGPAKKPPSPKPKPSIKLSFKKKANKEPAKEPEKQPAKEPKVKKAEPEISHKSDKAKAKQPAETPIPKSEEPEKPEKPEPIPDAALAEILASLPPEMIPPKRKGPGRPPKNGIMSKREQALLVRQQKEMQKAEAIKNGTLKASPIKPGLSEDPLTGKRKYTKRKNPDGTEIEGSAEIQDTIEGMEESMEMSPSAIKPLKDKRPAKPPRSPSPVFDEALLTPEQLAKPTQSYVVLIHEALSNAPSGQMSLPQIYRAIERRYPYFKLKVSTQGWQSSVRHNLSQHAAFKKIERDGKGWMWGLVPEVNIEKEKKRRPTPPPMPAQPYYQPPPQMFRPQQFSYPGMPPNGSQHPPHMPPPYGYPPAPGHGYPPGSYPPGMAMASNGLQLPPGAPQTTSTYQSPYAGTSKSTQQQSPQQQQQQQQQPQQHPQPPPHHMIRPPFYPPPHMAQGNRHGAMHTPSPVPQSQHYHQFQQRPPSIITPFEQTPPVVDQIGKFKEILLGTLTLPNAEQMIDRVINQATGKVPPSKEVNDPSTPDAGIYKALCDLLKPLREKYDRENAANQFRPPPPPLNGYPMPPTQPPVPGPRPVDNGHAGTVAPPPAIATLQAPLPASILKPSSPASTSQPPPSLSTSRPYLQQSDQMAPAPSLNDVKPQGADTPVTGPQSVTSAAAREAPQQPAQAQVADPVEEPKAVTTSPKPVNESVAATQEGMQKPTPQVSQPQQPPISQNTANVPTPLETDEKESISALLQRLGPKASNETPTDNSKPPAVETMVVSPPPEVPRQSVEDEPQTSSEKPSSATAVLHASEEAATLVMNAMGAGPKRQREEGDEQEDQGNGLEEPQSKRIAV